MALDDQIIGAESGGDPNATNPNSSAAGLGQFTAGTWNDLIRQYRPELAQGKSPQEVLALRSDPDLSRAMVRAYAGQNANALGAANLPATAGNLYLAHFAGPGGAIQVLKSDPATPVSQILSPAAIKANPFLKGMTAGDLTQWAAGKVGPQNSAPAAAAASPVASAPINATAQQPQPQQSSPGVMGMLSGLGSGNLEAQLGTGNGMLNAPPPAQAQQVPSAPAPSIEPPPQLQIPQGTLASQMMRMRLLASILGNQTA